LKQQREARALGKVATKAAFQETARKAYVQARTEISRTRPDGTRGNDIQYIDGELKVTVSNGYDRGRDIYTTDIIVADRQSPTGLHLHVGFDEHGNLLFEHWKENK
jgi:hypothetical protein